MKYKLIYLVLDGAAGSPKDKITSYEVAYKPALDELTYKSKCGMMYPIEKGLAPESDAAVMAILGYNPHEDYTGRGPIEALGADMDIKIGYEVAFRANFATVEDKSLKLVDRRVGRNLETHEAIELAKAIDNMDLGLYDGYARVKATVGHRAVVIIGSKTYKLSGNVGNTDPAYKKIGTISVAQRRFDMVIQECKPLDSTPEAKRTAELANIFTKKAIEILDDHPVNIERQRKGLLKANAILLRDSGDRFPKVEPIEKKFGLKFAAITEMPVERGIARLLQMKMGEVPPPTPDKSKDYAIRLQKTLELLKDNDVVYVHLKGPDEPGHDGDFERKVKAIEDIDKYYVRPLLNKIDLDKTAILVTSDHATPCSMRSHSGDAVPVVLYSPTIEPDKIEKLTEKNCIKGTLGIIEHGWLLLPKILKYLE